MPRVEGSMSRVEGHNFFNFFFRKMENKWKTNKNNLKNKWRVDISIHISSTYWVGRGEQNTLLDNRFLSMSDCLGIFCSVDAPPYSKKMS